MSGIYIPGVEMPNSCGACELSGTGICKHWLTMKKSDIGSKRSEKCPAIPVPDHGRLGDLDELSKRIKEETINQAELYADWHCAPVLAFSDCYGKCQNAPTIIPADKEVGDV